MLFSLQQKPRLSNRRWNWQACFDLPGNRLYDWRIRLGARPQPAPAGKDFDMRKSLIAIAISYFFLAAYTYGYQPRFFMQLEDISGGEGYGRLEAERMQFMPGQRSLEMDFFRLKPNAVYSVWFANNRGERTPAGVDRNHFRTDGGGKGRYLTTTYDDLLSKWRYIEVYYHPGGDPADTREMVAELRGDLVYGRLS